MAVTGKFFNGIGPIFEPIRIDMLGALEVRKDKSPGVRTQAKIGDQVLLTSTRKFRAARERIETAMTQFQHAGDRDGFVVVSFAAISENQAPFDVRNGEHQLRRHGVRIGSGLDHATNRAVSFELFRARRGTSNEKNCGSEERRRTHHGQYGHMVSAR
jgi:hypothetical protein